MRAAGQVISVLITILMGTAIEFILGPDLAGLIV